MQIKTRFQDLPHQYLSSEIDCSTFKLFRMIIAIFQVENKLGKAWFFQEIFLLADISIEVILEITLINADI